MSLSVRGSGCRGQRRAGCGGEGGGRQHEVESGCAPAVQRPGLRVALLTVEHLCDLSEHRRLSAAAIDLAAQVSELYEVVGLPPLEHSRQRTDHQGEDTIE